MYSLREATYLSQVRSLRELASSVLGKYPLQVERVDFIHHGQNTTFKVISSNGRKYLLRICCAEYHSEKSIKEELKWLQKLVSEGFNVPCPVKSNSSKFVEAESTFRIPEGRKCVLFEWVDGRFIWSSVNEDYVYKLGQFLGRLQLSGKTISIKNRMEWKADDIIGNSPRFGSTKSLKSATKKQQEIINLGRLNILKKLKTYEENQSSRQGLIHADLHFGNFIVNSGNISAFDFDDCGYGAYGYDLAVPISKFKKLPMCKRDSGRYDAFVQALCDGHSSVHGWKQKDYEILTEYLLARRISILGWLNSRLHNPTFLPYLKNDIKSVSKDLRKYL